MQKLLRSLFLDEGRFCRNYFPCFIFNIFIFFFFAGLSGLVDSMTKSASLGGQQVLNCHVLFPGGQTKPHVVQWNKAGLEQPVYMRYHNYPPQINPRFKGRLKIIRGTSLEISHIRTQDEGWYECKVTYLDRERDNGNGTWVYLNVNSKYLFNF